MRCSGEASAETCYMIGYAILKSADLQRGKLLCKKLHTVLRLLTEQVPRHGDGSECQSAVSSKHGNGSECWDTNVCMDIGMFLFSEAS